MATCGDCMTFVMFRTCGSVRFDDFPDPDPDRAQPPLPRPLKQIQNSGITSGPRTDSSKDIGLGQDSAHCIICCQFGLTLHWPLNANGRIAPQKAAFMLGVPVVRCLIEELC